MANKTSKASDWQKVSGFSGVITLGKEPTFDEVYGIGSAPMIVAHDKAVQRIPSPTRIAFESVLFGPSGDGKAKANRDHDIIDPKGIDFSHIHAVDIPSRCSVTVEPLRVPTAPPDATVNASSNPTGFVVGQWVECVSGQPGCLEVGYIDQIERISEVGILFLKKCGNSWGYERFKPFEWQVGRTYKTTLEGVTIKVASVADDVVLAATPTWMNNDGTRMAYNFHSTTGRLIACEDEDDCPHLLPYLADEQPSTPPDAAPTIVDEEHARLLAEAKLIRDIDTVKDFATLIPVAHEMAVSKGWWKDGIDKRPIEEIVANYHAEVSEAWEEYRAGRMKTWYATGSTKPEGFWIEIADLLIRIADAVGAGREHTTAHTRKLTPAIDIISRISHAEFINNLHAWITRGEHVVSYCERFALFGNVDLYAVVREKLRYNATRPYRHGGKLA